MALLKKIRAATLVGTLVASVIIVTIFAIASLSINNVFKGVIYGNDSALQNRSKELTYFTQHEKTTLPFYEETALWDISIQIIAGQTIMKTINKRTNTQAEVIIADEHL